MTEASRNEAAAYGAVWAADYDALYGGRDDPAAVVAFLEPLAPSRRVVEFGVGTGRIAAPLALAGFKVTGLDASPQMLEQIRDKPGGDKVKAVLGDMTADAAGGVYDLALLNFSSIFLLPSQEAQIACFANAARHLESGGRFVVEAFVPDHTRWSRGQNLSVSALSEGMVDIIAAVHDRAQQTMFSQHLVARAGSVSLRPTRYRYCWPAEMDLMARLAGMALERRFAGWDLSKYGADSGQHVSVYRKS